MRETVQAANARHWEDSYIQPVEEEVDIGESEAEHQYQRILDNLRHHDAQYERVNRVPNNHPMRGVEEVEEVEVEEVEDEEEEEEPDEGYLSVPNEPAIYDSDSSDDCIVLN